MPKKNTAAAINMAPPEKQPLSRITRDLRPAAAREKDLSGNYRMIHGSMVIPIPAEEVAEMIAKLRPGDDPQSVPRTRRATIHVVKDANGQPVMETYTDGKGSRVTRPKYMGDELWLNHEDAKSALAAGMIEPLDASPSKCGKMFAPAPETMNWAQSKEATQLHSPTI